MSIYMLNILSEITILSHNHIQLNKKLLIDCMKLSQYLNKVILCVRQ